MPFLLRHCLFSPPWLVYGWRPAKFVPILDPVLHRNLPFSEPVTILRMCWCHWWSDGSSCRLKIFRIISEVFRCPDKCCKISSVRFIKFQRHWIYLKCHLKHEIWYKRYTHMFYNNPRYPKVITNKIIYVKNNTIKTVLEFFCTFIFLFYFFSLPVPKIIQ